MTSYAADLGDIRAAADRIAGHAHRTPVATSSTLDTMAGRQLFLKCEQLQRAGSFKLRGALNSVLVLDDQEAALGVVTHSSGNFAQALALAASLRGIPAWVVMPRTAPAVKRRAVEGYGARVVECEPVLSERERESDRVQRETGATFVHPYDHPPTIAGQGTVALELVAQSEGLDAIIAPIGGGGLISGIALAARGLDPRIRVLAAEPAGADDAARSKAEGRLIPQTGPETICDGLLTSLGRYTWPVVRDLVERVVTVDDRAVVAAMRLVWERMKLVIEPSAAAAVAAALSDEVKGLEGLRRIGVVLSGGNVDLDRLPWMRASSHQETLDGNSVVPESETSDFPQALGDQGFPRRRTPVRRTRKAADRRRDRGKEPFLDGNGLARSVSGRTGRQESDEEDGGADSHGG